jgi:uncharacterized protein
MFKEERTSPKFDWSMLGDVNLGRPNLGMTMDVVVYRLMQFTLRDILIVECGTEKTDQIFYMAGELAGKEFFKNIIEEREDFDRFIIELQEKLESFKMGILRMEKVDLENLNFTLAIAEDLDCSGLPMCGEEICTYDEGFLSGILHSFTGQGFEVKEVDCWCSGDRVCRFEIKKM